MIEYDKDAIVHPYITDYLREVTPKNTGILKELEEYAEKFSVPIVQPETAQFLKTVVRMVNPERILEVGCAIGYSAILMASESNAMITTLEYNAEMAEKARENVEKAGMSDRIHIIEQDAREYVQNLSGEYDMIFLDGPKAHYIYMLNDCIRLLKKGGIIVADNVLYKGMTADEEHVVRRKITIVKRLKHFISAQMQREELRTTLIPIGDGITLAVKI